MHHPYRQLHLERNKSLNLKFYISKDLIINKYIFMSFSLFFMIMWFIKQVNDKKYFRVWKIVMQNHDEIKNYYFYNCLAARIFKKIFKMTHFYAKFFINIDKTKKIISEKYFRAGKFADKNNIKTNSETWNRKGIIVAVWRNKRTQNKQFLKQWKCKGGPFCLFFRKVSNESR